MSDDSQCAQRVNLKNFPSFWFLLKLCLSVKNLTLELTFFIKWRKLTKLKHSVKTLLARFEYVGVEWNNRNERGQGGDKRVPSTISSSTRRKICTSCLKPLHNKMINQIWNGLLHCCISLTYMWCGKMIGQDSSCYIALKNRISLNQNLWVHAQSSCEQKVQWIFTLWVHESRIFQPFFLCLRF